MIETKLETIDYLDKITISLINQKKHELVKEYNQAGQLIKETPYQDNKRHGIVKEYNQIGQVIKETPYHNDKKMGIQKIYYDGLLQLEIPYENDSKHGIMKGYYAGNEVGAILFINGIMITGG